MRPLGRFSFHTPNYIPLRYVVWPPRVSNAIGSGGLAPSRLRTCCTNRWLKLSHLFGLAPSRLGAPPTRARGSLYWSKGFDELRLASRARAGITPFKLENFPA